VVAAAVFLVAGAQAVAQIQTTPAVGFGALQAEADMVAVAAAVRGSPDLVPELVQALRATFL